MKRAGISPLEFQAQQEQQRQEAAAQEALLRRAEAGNMIRKKQSEHPLVGDPNRKDRTPEEMSVLEQLAEQNPEAVKTIMDMAVQARSAVDAGEIAPEDLEGGFTSAMQEWFLDQGTPQDNNTSFDISDPAGVGQFGGYSG